MCDTDGRYRMLFENSAEAVFFASPEGRIIEANPAACRIFGKTVEELRAAGWNGIMNLEDPRLAKALEERKSTGKFSGELTCKRHDGSVFPVEMTSSVFKDVNGEEFSSIIIHDISARRKAEDKLLASEIKYRAILDSSPVPCALNDDDLNIVFLNRSFIKTFGYTLEDIPRLENWWPKAYPDKEYRKWVSAEWLSRIEKARLDKRGFEPMEVVVRCKNGSDRNIVASAASLEGSFSGTHLVILYDVTERKNMETALLRSDILFDNVFEQSAYPMWISDESGNLVRINRANLKMLNIMPEDVIGKYNIFNDNVVIEQGFIPLVRDVYENGATVNFDLSYDSSKLKWLDLKSCVCVMLHVTIYPIKDTSGKVTNAIIHLTDITERKAAEDKIRNLLDEKELTLREVHHRIKNNMNNICSLLAMQADSQNDPTVKAILMDSASRVKSMSVLYDRLYRSENTNAISINDYLPPLIGDIAAAFPKKTSVSIEIKLDDIVLDAKKLSTIGIIINELLTNSLKYAFDGRSAGNIAMSASKKGSFVTIIYEDDGAGIPESISVNESSGFGMFLLGILAKQLHGSIRIEKAQGARFVIEFEA